MPLGRPPLPDLLKQPRSARRQLAILIPGPGETAPRAPTGLGPLARKVWRTFWGSAVSQAVDLQADGYMLSRWIRAVDEWEKVRNIFLSSRLLTVGDGMIVLNPLAAYLYRLEISIVRAESQLGMTPVARLRLGIAIGQARRTALDLMEDLKKGGDDTWNESSEDSTQWGEEEMTGQ